MRRAGATLCWVGLLVVAFVAYQIWGTALYESQAQARLRRQLAHEFGHHRPGAGAGREAAAGGTGGSAAGDGAGSATGDGAGSATGDGSAPGGRQAPQPAAAPAPVVPPPPVGSPVGILTIPSIGLDDVIVEGTGAAQLQQGPGHYAGTPLPGEPGNAAIAGHRTTYAHPFYDLNLLHPGDAVLVRTMQGDFRYRVVGTQVVPPSDVGVLASHGTVPTLTLTTCNPRYSAATRLVVTADFAPGRGAAPPHAPAAAPAPSHGAGGTTARPATATAGGGGGGGDGSGAGSGDGSGDGGSYLPGALWGLTALGLALALRWAWRRSPRRLRWPVAAVGVPLVLGCLLLCFEHLSLALPASF